MAGNQIQFGIGFNVNESGLNKLKQSLQEIQKMTAKDLISTGNFTGKNVEEELKRIQNSASQVQTALARAFNPSLNTTNITKFNQELLKLNIPQIAKDFNQLGVSGQAAFLDMTKQALSFTTPLKQNVSWLTKMGQTLTNTIKWNIASSAINALTGSVQSAFNYVKALDSSLTDIRIVTGESREEMAEFAVEANNAAQALGRQTKEYTNAALSFYQQGLNDEEVRVRTEATLKAQNITGAGKELADELTAVWNGFQVGIEESELAVDKLAAVADSSASNMSELATGMSKTASVANSMGVSLDQLTAQLATIIATTRQAPESVGNALKTIYTRINDIKTGSDDAEVSLGNYSKQMAQVGFSVLDANGNLRDTGEVIEEIGSRWQNLSREQQIYLARTMAGQRQMNNLVALFDNWTKYSEMLNVSLNAEGALNEKNARYMESLSAHMNQLKAATEGLQTAFLDSDGLIKMYDIGTDLIGLLESFIHSIGGMRGVLIGVGAIGVSAFKNQIAESIQVAINNLRSYEERLQQLKTQKDILKMFNMSGASYDTLAPNFKSAIDGVVQLRNEFERYRNVMTDASQQTANTILQQEADIRKTILAYDELIAKAVEMGNAALELQDLYGTSAQAGSFDASKIFESNTQTGTAKIIDEKELQRLITEVQYAKEELDKFKEDASNLAAAEAAMQKYEKKITIAKNQLTEAKQELQNLKNAKAPKEEIDAMQERVKALQAEIKKLGNAYKEASAEASIGLQELKDSVLDVATKTQTFGFNTQRVQDLVNSLTGSVKDDKAALLELIEIFDKGGAESAQFANQLKLLYPELEKLKQKSEETTSAYKQLIQTLQDAKIAKGLSSLLSGIGSLAMGIQMLTSAHKTYQEMQEGTIDSMEGWLRIITSVSMALPMLVSGFKAAFIEGIPALIGGIGTLITSLGGIVAASSSAGAALVAALGPVVVGAGAFIAIAAAIGAVVYGLVKLYQNLTKNTKAYKEQQKELEKLTKTAEESEKKYKDLKSTISSYQEAFDAIGQLTKGTEEWKEAIEKTNENAKELLALWPELASKVRIGANGELIIDKNDLKEAQQNALVQSTMDNMAVTQQEIEVQKAAVAKAAEGIRGFALFKAGEKAEAVETLGRNIYNNDRLKVALDIISENWDTLWAETYKKLSNEAQSEGLGLQTITGPRVLLQMLMDQGLNAEDWKDTLGYLPDEFAENAQLWTQYRNDWAQLFEEITAEGNLIENQKKALQQAILPIVQTTDSENQHLTAALMQAAMETANYDEENIKVILENVDEWVEISAKLSEGVDQRVIDSVVGFTQGIINFSSLTKEQIAEVRTFLAQHYQELGLDVVQIATQFAEEEKIWEERFETAAQDLSKNAKNVYDTLNLSDFTSPENAEKLGSFLEEVFQADYKEGLDTFKEIWDNSDNKKALIDIFTNLPEELDLETLTASFEEAGLGVETILEPLAKLIALLNQNSPQDNFDLVTGQYKEVNKDINGLGLGDSIDAEAADRLKQFGVDLNKFFMMGAEGEQVLIGKAEELQAAVDRIQMSNLVNIMDEAKEKSKDLINQINSIFTGEDLTTTASAYTTSEDDASIQLYDPSNVNWDKAKQQFDSLQLLMDQGLADIDSQKMANFAQMFEEGFDINRADGLLQQLADTVKENADAYDLLIGKVDELQLQYHNAEAALNSFRLKLDEDVDEEEWEDLTSALQNLAKSSEELDDGLENDKLAAAEVAQAILRFDDAIQNLTDNYEDWKDALDSKSLQRQTKAIEELRETYADLLDLDGSSLSESFLSNADNLELMKEAAEGSEEAYNQLMENVQQDIAAQVHLDISDFQTNFDALMAQYYEGQSLDDLAIGASLDNTDFLAGLSEMVTAAGMSAQQAMDYLGSMGIDAQVVEHSVPTTEEHETGDVQADLVPVEGTGSVSVVRGTGLNWSVASVPLPYTVYGTQYTPVTSSFTTTDEKKAVSLEVTSATKSSGGGFKHSQASHGGGGAGKKKSGGGGGGSKKQPKKTEKFKSKIDPYHDVNIKIGDVKEGLDKLGKQRDKLIGKDAVDNLAKQINLMEREKELLQEKAKIAQEELQKQADELAKYGAIIDSEGNILNYKQLLLDKQNQINEAIDIANGLDADSQEAYLKYVEDLKKEYKELEEGIKNLDDTKQLLDDLGLDYQDIINQQIELAMEAFNLEIEVHLDMKDAKKEFNEFRKKVMDQVKDDQYGGLAAAAARNYGLYYNNEGTGIIRELQQHALDIQREAEIVRNGGFSQIYGDNLAAAAEDLKKYNDELMKGLEEVQELVDEVHDDFLFAIDAMDEAFDTQQENLDKIDDLLQHDMEILQLIHGEENYDEMTLLWQQQVDQDTKRLTVLQQEQQYWKNRVAQYQEGTEEWKKAMENWEDAFEKTNEAMLNSVKNLQSQWENSINKIMSGLRNATYGGNMNAALEDWDKMTWHSDRYLDSLERATGLLNLQNKYQDMINKTTDPRIQAKSAELEEKQLDALSQKEHLREIDLKISEQQLAVLQAQMALEDAQQAKTKLRLRRDSQGNYTYQYVADEDDIAEKTEEYANALAEYRQMVKDSLHEDLQDLSDYTQEFYDKMQEAQMMYGDDTQRLMEEQARLYELYMGEDGYITRLAADANFSMRDLQEATYIQATGLNELLRDDLFNKFLGPNSEMRNAINELLGAGGAVPSILDAFVNDSAFVAFDNISEKCKETLSGPEGLLPEWQSALWTIAAQYETDFVPRVIEAMNQLQYANQAYVDGLAIMQQAANRTTEQIALGLYYDTAYTNALNDATNTLLQTQDAELQKAEQVYESLKKNEEAFKDQAQAAIDAANAFFLYWLALNGMTASTVPYTMNGISGVNISSPSTSSNSSSYSDGGSSGSGGGSGDTGSGSNKSPINDYKMTGVAKNAAGAAAQYYQKYGGNWTATATGPKRYATGGYTGEWNNDPRWALLDQKELVLNADDTKNMLSAVNIVRTIADKVASATNAAAANIGTQGLGSLLAAAGEQILQNVIINADFPAVQDAAQIKQAFNELVNMASQRASVGGRNR